jgi:4'-phosphopantetheinyl transferase
VIDLRGVHLQLTSWRTPSRLPALGADEIHVWRARISELAPHERALHVLLDAGERQRGASFHFDVDRVRHVVSHGLLRTLVGGYLGKSPAGLCFEAGEYGKPYLAANDAGGLAFNLSHSGDVVLVALAQKGNVGVDVECWTDRIDELGIDRIAASVFSLTERAALAPMEPAARRAAFYAMWSRKEAYIKATGFGVSRGLDHFDVSHGADARLLEDRNRAAGVEGWTLFDLAVGSGYSGAAAVDNVHARLIALSVIPELLSS